MASPTYTTRALVLRKTKLGESDLIVSLLAEDGSGKARCGRRGLESLRTSFRAGSSFTVRSICFALRGRSLDVVKEVRLVDAHASLRDDLERASAAACMCELLEKTAQEELAVEKVFAMTRAALSSLEHVRAGDIVPVVAGHLLKTIAFVGFRPSFNRCVGCGSFVGFESGAGRFSSSEGGVFCPSCARHVQTTGVAWATLSCAHDLLTSRFVEIEDMEIPPARLRRRAARRRRARCSPYRNPLEGAALLPYGGPRSRRGGAGSGPACPFELIVLCITCVDVRFLRLNRFAGLPILSKLP